MTDTTTKISQIRSDSERLFEESCGELTLAAYQTGLLAFTLSASDPQLERFWAERTTGNLDELVANVCTAPAVVHAVKDAIKAVEKELHSTFAVVEEQG